MATAIAITASTTPAGQYIKYVGSRTAFNIFDINDTVLVSGSVNGNNGVYLSLIHI